MAIDFGTASVFRQSLDDVFTRLRAASLIILPWALIETSLTYFTTKSFWQLAAVILLYLTGGVSMAVNWHRLVLLNERPKIWQLIRFDKFSLHYLGQLMINLLLVTLAIALVAADYSVMSLFVNIDFLLRNPTVFVTVYVGIIFGAWLFNATLAVSLPAVAIGNVDYEFSDGHRFGRKHWFQIALLEILLLVTGFLLAFVGVFLQNLLSTPWDLMMLLGKDGTVTNMLYFLKSVEILVPHLVAWFNILLSISVITCLYKASQLKREV